MRLRNVIGENFKLGVNLIPPMRRGWNYNMSGYVGVENVQILTFNNINVCLNFDSSGLQHGENWI